MVAPNKQRMVTKILSHLGKVYDDSIPDKLSVLDHLLIGVLQEGTDFANASVAFQRLKTGFFDENEIRVSRVSEVAELLEGLPDKERKAKRVVEILQFVFETTYSFDLESMRRKPLKQAQKQLSKITGATDFTVAATVQRALGGHAIPIDVAICEILATLGMIEEGSKPQDVRSAIEHLVPKAKGIAFSLLLSSLAADQARKEELIAAILPKSKKAGSDEVDEDEDADEFDELDEPEDELTGEQAPQEVETEPQESDPPKAEKKKKASKPASPESDKPVGKSKSGASKSKK